MVPEVARRQLPALVLQLLAPRARQTCIVRVLVCRLQPEHGVEAMQREIPVVDLTGAFTGDAAARLRTGRHIDRICTEIGFFTITSHGVPRDVIWGLNRKA